LNSKIKISRTKLAREISGTRQEEPNRVRIPTRDERSMTVADKIMVVDHKFFDNIATPIDWKYKNFFEDAK